MIDNREKVCILTVLLLLFVISCTRDNHTLLNFDFEQINSQSNLPTGWIIDDNPNYNIELDQEIRRVGSSSLKIERIQESAEYPMGSSTYIRYGSSQEFTTIELSGYLKAENAKADSSGLFIATENMKDYVVLKNKSLNGTYDWENYSLELQLDGATDKVYVGVVLFGEGKIWADGLRLRIDGKRVDHIVEQGYVANRKEIDWLRNNCVEINSVRAGSGFDDLKPLKDIIGNARVVALGENTHGSSEVFTLKHRLIEFLAAELDFTIFSIEANMPEAYRLNDYVLHGIGNPSTLLSGMYFWTWNTKEVYDMILWMRKFNQSQSGRIQFTGFDMQYCDVALENIREYARKNDRMLEAKLDTLMSFIVNSSGMNRRSNGKNETNAVDDQARVILRYIIQNEPSVLSHIDQGEYNWLVQNARVLVQYSNPRRETNYSYRDSCMAENFKWIVEQNPNEKIVLWAHDGHISRMKDVMGEYLADEFGEDYYNIGFVSNSGTYTAYKSGYLNSKNEMLEGKPGSFEYSFHRTGIPYFFIDFNQAKMDDPASTWLTKSLDKRSIGAIVFEDQEFYPTTISEDFNAIIYLDSTHATHCYDVVHQ